MEIIVSLKVQDFVYRFYQKSGQMLHKRPEELMEQALFQYAGTIAQELISEAEDRTEKP